jgi:hypothetical protein
MVVLPRLIAALAAGLLCSSLASAKNYRLTIAPAPADRADQLVTLKLPADAPKSASLQTETGESWPVQIGADGTAAFIVPTQKAGEAITLSLREAKGIPAAAVIAKADKQRVHLTLKGAPLFDYQMDKEALPRPDIKPEYKRAGYLHPIYTPSGKIVSDDYPPQHIHHHGIWTPWTKTSFQGRTPDFWNMGGKTGTVEFVALDRTWNGTVHGGFVARHRFVDLSAPSPVVALNETWEVTAYNAPSTARVFDLVVTQTCATSDPLILPTYHYGGLGFRARGEWLGKGKANFLTSEGETDAVKANAQRMRWVHVWGPLEGSNLGLAVLGHPDNFRAPQPVRVHPSEPYVSFIPSQLGDWQIDPGKPYVARYRFVTIDGAPDRAKLDALWNGYALPPVVKLVGENAP